LRPGGEAHRAQHGGRDRARPRDAGLPISGIGGVTTWRDAAEFLALGAGTVQVCTAAMTYGFKIVEEMKSGLSQYLDEQGMELMRPDRARGAERHRLAVPEPQLRHQGADRPGRLHPVRALLRRLRGHLAPGDLHVPEDRVFEVIDEECVACNLCVNVCPVEGCITMEELAAGVVDLRTGKTVSDDYANWTTHPNNPGAVKAAE
jgi:dihydropyrimidine dehydrogenase (NAD+) subunit PreA